ncbi:splicing factor Cactin-like [Miscanthus floridulus]|uniref:splicing factor Cactin-like n=1 Tax=Miscanthus floridulus TaxID=154761 RepID=UPI0034596B9D
MNLHGGGPRSSSALLIRSRAASPAIAREEWEATRPSNALRSAVRRRAASVSEKLAARGLGAFVWRKKLDRDLSRGILPGIVSVRSERRRCLARRREAAGVRAASAAARRASSPPPVPPAASLARAEEEEAKEAAFLLQQGRLRAAIRFAEGRPRRIDMLVESLRGARRGALAAFRGASAEELKELGEEIGTLADLDRENGRFWEAAQLLCDAEMVKAAGAGADGRSGRSLHSEVAADVMSVVEGKSIEELEAMQQTIAARMADGESKVVDQLQEVTELIRVEKARSSWRRTTPPATTRRHRCRPPSLTRRTRNSRTGARTMGRGADEEGSEPLGAVALPPTETLPAGPEWRKPRYVARVRTGHEWNKYNRVHYDHDHDHDHPPPKVVKGYTFVLHYPDLDLAGGKPPQYTVEEDGSGSDETCIVRFHAGWPYEDVAFRMVNREWERSRKAGFRSTFDRGVLRLSFHFKRVFYRR